MVEKVATVGQKELSQVVSLVFAGGVAIVAIGFLISAIAIALLRLFFLVPYLIGKGSGRLRGWRAEGVVSIPLEIGYRRERAGQTRHPLRVGRVRPLSCSVGFALLGGSTLEHVHGVCKLLCGHWASAFCSLALGVVRNLADRDLATNGRGADYCVVGQRVCCQTASPPNARLRCNTLCENARTRHVGLIRFSGRFAKLMAPSASVFGFNSGTFRGRSVSGGRFMSWLERSAPRAFDQREALISTLLRRTDDWIDRAATERDAVVHDGFVPGLREATVSFSDEVANLRESDVVLPTMETGEPAGVYCSTPRSNPSTCPLRVGSFV